MKGLIVLANGFEDTEAICTIDILKRSGMTIVSATPHENLEVVSRYGLNVKADIHLAEATEKDFDFLVIPGGRAVFEVWDKNEEISKLIKDFIGAKKLVAAICAAPLLVGKIGGYENEKYTCFPGCDEKVTSGKLKGCCGTITSGNFITGKAMYYTTDFALAIVEKLLGKEKKKEILRKIKGRG